MRRMFALLLCALCAGPILAQTTKKPAAPVAKTQDVIAELSGRTLDDKPWSLDSARGKVVLVVFWSKDCAICRDRMPEMRANYAGWKGKPFELVSVSTDASMRDVTDYEKILAVTVPQAQNFPRLWRNAPGHHDNFGSLKTLPASFLIDRNGKVVKQFVGRLEPAIWDDIAEMVLQ